MSKTRHLIVGAGFSGAVLARELCPPPIFFHERVRPSEAPAVTTNLADLSIEEPAHPEKLAQGPA